MSDRRSAVVDRLSDLLERDVIDLDIYRRLVDRVLATTDDDALSAVLAAIPEEPPLLIHCRDGVVRERPHQVPPMTAVTCDSGVLKVDLSEAELAADVDLDIECDSGVLSVVLPRDATVTVEGRSGDGGVLLNRLHHDPGKPSRSHIHVYVHNGGGVVRLHNPRRWFLRRFR